MKFPLEAEAIAELLAPLRSSAEFAANVCRSWPVVLAALEAAGIGDAPVAIAAAATVRVECPPFHPIVEYGGPRYFTQMYEGRADLGNTQPGDGARFCGRGFLQITGRANYAKYSAVAGVDLVTDPDKALDAEIAAKILARYFLDHRIAELARAGDWTGVRRKVNGGTNGLAMFRSYVAKLEDAMKQAAQPTHSVPSAVADGSAKGASNG